MDSGIPVKDVMTTPLETVSDDVTVQEATKRMREKEINALVVRTDPPSIVTSTDVLDAVAAGQNLSKLTVADVMTESVETVPPDLHLEEVAAMMVSLGIKHLPVVDEDPIGMVSSTDIAAQLS